MQNYKLKDFKVSDFKDDFGNTWCEAIFEGVGEPVKWVLKEPSSVTLDVEYYGEIKEMTSKAGKPYNRFYRAKPEDVPQSRGTQSSSKTLDYEPSTNARWAIGMAYRACIQVTGTLDGAGGDFPFELVEEHAKKLVEMFERIKDGKVSVDTLIKESGKDNFKKTITDIRDKNDPPPSDEDFQG